MTYQSGDKISFDEVQKLFPDAAATFPDDPRDYKFMLLDPLDAGDPNNIFIDGQEYVLNAHPNSDFDNSLTWLAHQYDWIVESPSFFD